MVALNEILRVNLKVTSSTVPMLIAYGTADYASGMRLPYKSGNG